MIRFDAVIKVSDIYGHTEISDDEIKRILTDVIENDADMKLIEIISIERKEKHENERCGD